MSYPDCYICEAPATEKDHFPIPKALGGKETLPICRGCHDAKDRILLAHWGPRTLRGSLFLLWGRATIQERRVLAKLTQVAAFALALLRENSPAVSELNKVPVLELSSRTVAALESAGIYTVADLCARSEAELMKLHNFGRKSLMETKHFLADRGLKLSSGVYEGDDNGNDRR